MTFRPKPSCHKVKLQDVVRPPDIQIVKPVNSSSDLDSLLIGDLGEYLPTSLTF
jgi:hypothetical protein